jgi:cell wall-associated NlpC family hydrolase
LTVRARVLATAALVCAGAVVVTVDRVRDEDPRPARSQEVASLEPGAVVRDPEEDQAYPEPESSRPHRVAESPLQAAETAEEGISPGAPSDEQVKRDLEQLERYYGRGGGSGAGAVVVADGFAQASPDAPGEVAMAVAGGNEIARFPYRWGGGHGSFLDNAYDCSGSVSYALAAAGLLEAPLASPDLMRWGKPGPGRWITVYANPGHVYMEVGGVRFDTSGRGGRRGSRWQLAARSARGFAARHPPGL